MGSLKPQAMALQQFDEGSQFVRDVFGQGSVLWREAVVEQHFEGRRRRSATLRCSQGLVVRDVRSDGLNQVLSDERNALTIARETVIDRAVRFEILLDPLDDFTEDCWVLMNVRQPVFRASR